MTLTFDPFDDKHKLDYRSEKNRIGRPFYGSELKKIVNPEPKEPIVSRSHDYWEGISADPMFWKVIVLGGCAAICFALLIVLL